MATSTTELTHPTQLNSFRLAPSWPRSAQFVHKKSIDTETGEDSENVRLGQKNIPLPNNSINRIPFHPDDGCDEDPKPADFGMNLLHLGTMAIHNTIMQSCYKKAVNQEELYCGSVGDGSQGEKEVMDVCDPTIDFRMAEGLWRRIKNVERCKF